MLCPGVFVHDCLNDPKQLMSTPQDERPHIYLPPLMYICIDFDKIKISRFIDKYLILPHIYTKKKMVYQYKTEKNVEYLLSTLGDYNLVQVLNPCHSEPCKVCI